MKPRETITIKDIDVFLYMLKEDKNVAKNTELYLDFHDYPKDIPNNITSKIIEAIKSKSHYSMITIDIFNSKYNRNYEKIINAISEKRFKNPLTLNFSLLETDDLHKPIESIIKTLTKNRCPDNLTILLQNCAITDSVILKFSKALASGKCTAQGLKFSNVKISYPDNRGQNRNIITNDGARALIVALKCGKCPKDLQIDLTGNPIDDELQATINSLINENNKKYDLLACVILQQGIKLDQFYPEKIPAVVADKICEYVIPIAQSTKSKTLEKI